MELDWLDDFIALSQTRNFTRAADLRNTTQSAYSRRIQRLEDWLGVALFERKTRPVSLTDAGNAFIAPAKRLRGELLDLRRIACAASTDLQNATRIYTTNTLAIGLLPHWVLQERIEPFALTVASTTTCLQAVRDGRADIGLIPSFSEKPLQLNDLNSTIIAQDRLAFCATDDLVDHIWMDPHYLYGPIMTYAPGTAYGMQTTARLQELGTAFANAPVCESASAEALLAQARLGMGAGWVPQSMILKTDQLCPLLNHVLDIDYDIIKIERR